MRFSLSSGSSLSFLPLLHFLYLSLRLLLSPSMLVPPLTSRHLVLFNTLCFTLSLTTLSRLFVQHASLASSVLLSLASLRATLPILRYATYIVSPTLECSTLLSLPSQREGRREKADDARVERILCLCVFVSFTAKSRLQLRRCLSTLTHLCSVKGKEKRQGVESQTIKEERSSGLLR